MLASLAQHVPCVTDCLLLCILLLVLGANWGQGEAE